VPCYNPVRAFKSPTPGPSGKHDIRFLRGNSTVPIHYLEIELPCGGCIGCRLEHSRQWAVRCMHEASLHDQNCFLTLTYDDDHLPEDGSLSRTAFPSFMKRLRKAFPAKRIGYYHVGEYGETTFRPHYHALLFGFMFPDMVRYKGEGERTLYTSQTLDRLWGLGECKIGALTFESAAYVARYTMKKQRGQQTYRRRNVRTGEVHDLVPEFSTMSLKPALGKKWFERFHGDVYPDDFVVVNGKQQKPPRYYDKLLAQEAFESVKAKRHERAQKPAVKADNSPERRAVREQVKQAQISTLKRTLL